MREADACVIGIDLGGTEIKGAMVKADGLLIQKHRVQTPLTEGREGILREIRNLVGELKHSKPHIPVVGIGIGSAGLIDHHKGKIISAANLPGWSGTSVVKEISEMMELPVYVDNDVNAAALGEAWIGSANDSEYFAFISLGTGVGGALVYNGRTIHGMNGGAGEVGHMILKPGGLPCKCGQKGCLEQYVSGTALNRYASELSPNWNSYILMKQFQEGELRASHVVEAFVNNLAIGLISIQNIFDPERFIIGGGLAASKSVWWHHLLSALKEHSSKDIRITPAMLGNEAGMIGAAKLCLLK